MKGQKRGKNEFLTKFANAIFANILKMPLSYWENFLFKVFFRESRETQTLRKKCSNSDPHFPGYSFTKLRIRTLFYRVKTINKTTCRSPSANPSNYVH